MTAVVHKIVEEVRTLSGRERIELDVALGELRRAAASSPGLSPQRRTLAPAAPVVVPGAPVSASILSERR